MKILCIYHSETGNTHSVMEEISRATGAEMLRVRDRAGYGKVTMYIRGIPRALRGTHAAIEPDAIDLSGYDLVILGSPVWASRPTPAANAMIQALKNCLGKKALLVCTSGGGPGETLTLMENHAKERGMEVAGSFHVRFSMRGDRNQEEMAALIQAVTKLAEA
ncbi:ArsR family transcriptional regulator [Methanocalculus taiwanensis]|uniref:ArsR family transcriptional regulator n=1 Tax=Methanocalculus taiwanensis TaxID=106207 RepID=A0ABD4TM14_9EURY|nr:ArsR family transcriptional regulator [Methanocalculus taiwanensis]MCQ1538335.1 ArsR family transcriptional regulator [Methanocalculus taiwanensis]